MYNSILPSGAGMIVSLANNKPKGPLPADSFSKAAFADRFVASDISVSKPDWSKMRTKAEPTMSEEEYEKAIIEAAKKDALNGVRRFSSKESSALMESYISIASPDRKSIYAESMNKTGGKLNITHAFFTGNGESVLHYNTHENQWMQINTKAEISKRQEFTEIYNKAYNETYYAMQKSNSQSGLNIKA